MTKELKKWYKHILISVIFLLIFIVSLFVLQLKIYNWDTSKIAWDLNFYLRFILASPIVYYITFVSIQYEKTKRLVDKYSFKTTLTMSIKAHLELLSNNSKFVEKNHINDILNFTLEAFRNIYNDPFSDEEFRIQMKLKDIELNLEKNLLNNFKNNILNSVNGKEKRLSENHYQI